MDHASFLPERRELHLKDWEEHLHVRGGPEPTRHRIARYFEKRPSLRSPSTVLLRNLLPLKGGPV